MYLQTHMPTSHMHAHMGTGAHTYERERELITHVSVYSRIFCKGEEFISILLKNCYLWTSHQRQQHKFLTGSSNAYIWSVHSCLSPTVICGHSVIGALIKHSWKKSGWSFPLPEQLFFDLLSIARSFLNWNSVVARWLKLNNISEVQIQSPPQLRVPVATVLLWSVRSVLCEREAHHPSKSDALAREEATD